MNMIDSKNICADGSEHGKGRMKVRKIIVPRVKSNLTMAQIRELVSEMMGNKHPKKSTKKKSDRVIPFRGKRGQNLSDKKMTHRSKSGKLVKKRAMDIIKIKGLG